MRSMAIIIAVFALTGCASAPEWLGYSERYGYRDEDPCIRCGEKWMQLPNEPFEAQKRYARGERW